MGSQIERQKMSVIRKLEENFQALKSDLIVEKQRIFKFNVVAVSKGKSQNSREKIKRRKNPQPNKEKKKAMLATE